MRPLAEIADEPQVAPPSSRRRLLWIEFVIVALYLFVPSLFASLFPRSTIDDPLYYVYSAVFALGRVGIVLFVVWTVDGCLDRIGLVKPVWKFDLGLAGLVLATYFLIGFLAVALAQGQVGVPLRTPRQLLVPADKAPLFLALFSSVFYAVEREILLRGYTIGRLQELGKQWIAVIASALLFSVATLRYGFPSWLYEFVLALLLGLAFTLSRRIWAGIFAQLVLYTLMTISAYAMASGGVR